MIKTDLDPFRVIIGVVADQLDSDLLAGLASAAGLRFDAVLSEAEAYSHRTRIRARAPRIVAAYDRLGEVAALGAANAFVAAMVRDGGALGPVRDALRRVGWDLRGEELIVADPDLREMFFPKNSRWDAYVVLRGLFGEASAELVIVDSYCDNTVFQMLAERGARPIKVRILGGQSATALVGEAAAFSAQFPGWKIEVRRAKDFHDRFVVLDGIRCIHIGASINGAGKTAFMVSPVEDPENRSALLKQIERSWSAGRVP